MTEQHDLVKLAIIADTWKRSYEQAASRIEALESRERALREALEPFARAARSIDIDPPGDDEPSHGRGSVTAGDLRRARAALAVGLVALVFGGAS